MLKTKSKKPKYRKWTNNIIGDSDRAKAYRMKSILFSQDGKLTTETRKQGDLIYDSLDITGYKETTKREILRQLLHTAKIANYQEGIIRYSRNKNGRDYSQIELQIIDKMVEDGYFIEQRSPPGSPKMSRLIPTNSLTKFLTVDPWTFDPPEETQFVYLRNRITGKDIPFNVTDPVPSEIQNKLAEINQIIRETKINFRKYNDLEDRFTGERGLAPIHYALFTNDFNHHGRLYTGKYGHQSLRKIERSTITFDGESSVEFDYSGTHPRMLYHLEGVDYRKDPYALWGSKTTEQMRLMAKVLVNALINAESKESAVSACNRSMCTKTSEGDRKQGKSLRDAQNLYNASVTSKLKFKEIVSLVMRYHSEIAHCFGEDKGVELMRIDSVIALDILHHFASHCIPCLGCHDSFIVPASEKRRLKIAMDRYYRKRLLFSPTIH